MAILALSTGLLSSKHRRKRIWADLRGCPWTLGRYKAMWQKPMAFFIAVCAKMTSEQVTEIRERIHKAGIGLKDTMSIIDMALQEQPPRLRRPSPYGAFTDLNKLIDLTVHGAKIERFRPRDNRQPFHTLEIHTEEGEVLGYLNMIYLKRVIPCYYLVYVEVMPPFRGLGLGHRILRAFMEFVNEKKAVGLLDNIIPLGEVTYEIYTKLGWKNIQDLIGNGVADGWGHYMVFVPESIQTHDLRNKLIRILFALNQKRPVIDMHDNEDMVKRTIEEFRSVYQALEGLYREEILLGTSNPLLQFMFTRLTTKLIGFRRRIASLIGYTGGESIEQISFSGQIKELDIQPYSLWKFENEDVRIWGDKRVLRNLPSELKEEPTFFIEGLPPYARPYLHDWTEKMKNRPSQSFKISDLLDLGFDPTRLREFHHSGVDYIFERVSPHFFYSLVRKKRFLKKIERSISKLKFHGAIPQINPPLFIFRDRGNIYALRKKVEGIHSTEALDQLKTSRYLKDMNAAVGIDRAMVRTISDIRKWIEAKFKSRFSLEIEDLTYFLPWDIERNIPRIHVDPSGVSLDVIWIA
jgi:GNAT superfamily N-acetyltransferase